MIVPRTWNKLTHAHTHTLAHTPMHSSTRTHTNTHKRARARLYRGAWRRREAAARSPEETIDKRKRKNVKTMDCVVKNTIFPREGRWWNFGEKRE